MKPEFCRRGDKALVLQSQVPSRVGRVVNVLSDPLEAPRTGFLNQIEVPPARGDDGTMKSNLIRSEWLLRLPPPDEAKRMFWEHGSKVST